MSEATEKLRQKILEVGEKVFSEHGFTAAEMREIARKAGVAVGTLYNYYRGKNELFQAIMRQDWNDLEQGLEDILADKETPFDLQIEKLALLHLKFIRKHRTTWKDVIDFHRTPVSLDFLHNFEQYITTIARLWEQNTVYKGKDARRVALVFIAGLNSLAGYYPGEEAANAGLIHSLLLYGGSGQR